MDTDSDALNAFNFIAEEPPIVPARTARPFKAMVVTPNPRCRELYPEGFSFNVVRASDDTPT